MPKRHRMRPGDWESIFGRLQELVLANSGEDDFEEVFKLLVAKLYFETYPTCGYSFASFSSPNDTAQNINALLARAAERWKGIVQGQPSSNLTDEHLTICVQALEEHSLIDTNLEVLDGAFEYLVSKKAKGSKGQYFTPRHVIDCCIQMLAPNLTETVIDPACGSSGFLIHTLSYIRQNYPSANLTEYCQNNLWGCDFDRRAIQIAKALMLIAGDGSTNLFQLNSLITNNSATLFSNETSASDIPQLTIEDIARSKIRHFKGFDIVVANPPFAGEVKELDVLQNYELYKKGRRLERDVLFLERCVGLLKPGGRLAIVLPHNKFSSESWAYLREWLVQQIQVVSVLGLGRNTFLPHTHQKTSVLFGIKRLRPQRSIAPEKILFLISEKEGKDSKGQIINKLGAKLDDPTWLRADHDLDELASSFKDFRSSNQIPWGNV